MFPTKETEKNLTETSNTINDSFESLDQFAAWLDDELDTLVIKYAEFETDKSVRKFFKRS